MTPDPSEAPQAQLLAECSAVKRTGWSSGTLVMGQGSSGGGFVRRRLSR